MPFALIIVGTVLLVSGLLGNGKKLAALLQSDFTGSDSFLYWIAVILILGALGYIEKLRPLSRVFMGLVILVLFLSDGGFFSKFFGGIMSAGSVAPDVTPSSGVTAPTITAPTVPAVTQGPDPYAGLTPD
ncbi:MAG: hypothetical protein ACP5EP_12275 [Acidobacteriaceae bacterium]